MSEPFLIRTDCYQYYQNTTAVNVYSGVFLICPNFVTFRSDHE